MKKSILIIFILLTPFLAHAQTAEEYFKQGVTKIDNGDYDGAIENFNKVIELDPKNAKAYAGRGNAKGIFGDNKGAIQDYNKAIELNPNYADAYNNRGIVKYKLGDYRGAIQDFNKAIGLALSMLKHTTTGVLRKYILVK